MTVSLDVVDWPVRTERLVLRRLTDGDLARIFAYRSQPEVAEWIGSTSPDVDALAERFGDGATAVVVEHRGRLIGDLMVKPEAAYAQREVAEQAVGSQAELGWTFDPGHHGHGFATEPSAPCSGSASGTWGCTASWPPASRTTSRRGG